jgi:ubiquinone/menaquinone biosynthesis C-methylase UbiE
MVGVAGNIYSFKAKKVMEERKEIEREHYNKKIGGHSDGFDPFLLSSYRFLRNYLRDKCQGKKILDYGCGNGVHSFWLADFGGDVTAIDISENSLKIAKEKSLQKKSGSRVKFIAMDCEKLEFEDNHFDIIFDGGSFSSLDLNKAYPELARVLKPNGFVIGIETFGHNPIINLKRQLNKVVGKRTSWAVSHIFNENYLKEAQKYFGKTETYFFHLTSWTFLPKFFNIIDSFLLKIKFLQKYAFKIVFIFKKTV